MKLTKKHLKDIQIELFFQQLETLDNEEIALNEHFNIARNLACAEWEEGAVPSICGGRDGIRISRILPNTMDLLNKNFDQQQEEISYRRYALIKAYYPVIKKHIGGKLELCLKYWESKKDVYVHT